MDPVPSAHAEAAAVAGLVPRLLDTYVETAEQACEEAVTSAIERCADRLLVWHDDLVGVRAPEFPAEQVTPTRPVLPAHKSVALAESIRAGEVPGSPHSLELAGGELLHVSGRLREIAASPAVRDRCRPCGVHLADTVERLAHGLREHADVLRESARDLDRIHRQHPEGPDELDTGQVLGRVVRAEHALGRLAVGTLPQ